MLAVVARMLKVPDGTMRVLVQATERVRIERFVSEQPYLIAAVDAVPDVVEPSPELEALTRNVQRTFTEIIEQIPYLPEELQLAVTNVDDPSALAHLIAGALRISTEEKQELLEEVDVGRRLRRLSEILARELEVISLGTEIQSQVESEMQKGQREYYLREQLKAIQRELGEEDETQAEVNELRERIEAAALPEAAQKAADRELSRLERLPSAAAEYGVIRTYLEWLVELPWSRTTTDNLDIKHAREVLDADHYDLEKVKDRILEYLAVRSLNPESHGPILCFAGPPGVGKTSLGKSIARALGREFERISVGGVRDEAEIRGHRRTYVGAMPGTIVRALRDAGSRNPVFMIDEIDKMGADFRGDPASAMLEVLDPSQNDSFRDHYLDVQFDLSRGAVHRHREQPRNDPGSPARSHGGDPARRLHDRREAAHRQALPGRPPARRERAQGVAGRLRRCGPEGRHRGVHARGRGAQPRARDRHGLPQARARDRRERDRSARRSGEEADHLGQARPRAARPPPGVLRDAAPDARTRASRPASPGRRSEARCCSSRRPRCRAPVSLTITGQLGEVMKESAQAALSWVRGHARMINPELPDDWFAEHDIHVHVPAGAVPKDGPSAGVAMATALSSLIAAKPVRSEVAMTGEITLTGQVLPSAASRRSRSPPSGRGSSA